MTSLLFLSQKTTLTMQFYSNFVSNSQQFPGYFEKCIMQGSFSKYKLISRTEISCTDILKRLLTVFNSWIIRIHKLVFYKLYCEAGLSWKTTQNQSSDSLDYYITYVQCCSLDSYSMSQTITLYNWQSRGQLETKVSCLPFPVEMGIGSCTVCCNRENCAQYSISCSSVSKSQLQTVLECEEIWWVHVYLLLIMAGIQSFTTICSRLWLYVSLLCACFDTHTRVRAHTDQLYGQGFN